MPLWDLHKLTLLTMEVNMTSKDLSIFNSLRPFSIGFDDMFEQFESMLGNGGMVQSNYPPYNLVTVSNVESRLELALAGFKKKEVYVYTQDGKLFVEGQKEDKETGTEYVHRGVAQRSFTRSWTLSDETEVRSVTFEDGLLSITLGKIVPEHHQRKDYL